MIVLYRSELSGMPAFVWPDTTDRPKERDLYDHQSMQWPWEADIRRKENTAPARHNNELGEERL